MTGELGLAMLSTLVLVQVDDPLGLLITQLVQSRDAVPTQLNSQIFTEVHIFVSKPVLCIALQRQRQL